MTIQLNNNEIVLKFPAKMKISKKQEILDYLKFEELIASVVVAEIDISKLSQSAKKGRWKRVKSTLNIK